MPNTKTRFLPREQLWPTIGVLASKAKGVRRVASAYVGAGASKMLPLRKGDVLLCALSIVNAKAGTVNPSELKKLRRRGVRLYRADDLHAKIYLLGDSAVVGSANASTQSRDRLDEAALLTRDPETIADVKAWFDVRCTQEVSPQFLEECAQAYRPPRGPIAATKRHGKKNDARVPSTWLLWNVDEDSDFTESEQETADADEARAKQRFGRRRGFERIPLAWAGKDIALHLQPGDLLVCVYQSGPGWQVEAMGECLTCRRLAGNEARIVGWGAWAKPSQRISWQRFAARCKRDGLELSSGRSRRFTRIQDRAVLQKHAGVEAMRREDASQGKR